VGVREIGRDGFAAGETVIGHGRLRLMGLAAKIIACWMMPHV
jgi:hypothetical protein